MFTQRFGARRAFAPLAGLAVSLLLAAAAAAQGTTSTPLHFHVSGPSQRLEMIVNTSRILTLDFKVPNLLVNNENTVTARPISPNQIQVFARQPGITQVVLWDEEKNAHSIDIFVFGDARELENLLHSVFPDADIHVRPTNGSTRGSVILSGFVPQASQVSRIEQIAREFYPNVINNMEVGGVQQVLLHVKVLEVSRTKLRRLGVDWSSVFGGDFIVSGVSGLINAAAATTGTLTGTGTVRFGIMDGGNQFFGLIDVLRQHNLAKLLAEPTLVTVSGRPASFNSGGEVPVPVSAGLGVTTVEYREFGTQIDFVPIVLGNGNIRLEVRPQITEIAADLRDPVTQTPGFRSRRVDTGVEMKAGQTLALAGLIQSRVEASNQGIPVLADIPWVGAAFRRVQEQVNEIELLIMVTPEFVGPLQPCEVPPGPGTSTQSPTDVELYWRGYLETPYCGDGGYPYAQPIPPAGSHGSDEIGPGYEQFPAYEQVPAAPRTPQPDPGQGARRSIDNRSPYRQNTQHSSSRPAPVHVETTPRLIGPVGYDVLK